MSTAEEFTKYMEDDTLAHRLMDYIKKRAKVEGVGFDLPLEFFEQAVKMGANPIFGVHHDGEKMLCDDQEPHADFFNDNTKKE